MQLQVELQKRKEIMYLEANKQKKEKKKTYRITYSYVSK